MTKAPQRRVLSTAAVLCAMLLSPACKPFEVQQHETAIPIERESRIVLRDAAAPVVRARNGGHRVASLLNVSTPMEYGEFVWAEDPVPPGESWVLVDLAAQTISVFRGAHEIGTAVALFGADEKPTPVGALTILAKLKDHRSSLYDAPMPYTLRLTGDGVAIHGSNVRYGAATHGCLGVPLDFAKRLFDELDVGDDVVIYANAQTSLGSTLDPGSSAGKS